MLRSTVRLASNHTIFCTFHEERKVWIIQNSLRCYHFNLMKGAVLPPSLMVFFFTPFLTVFTGFFLTTALYTILLQSQPHHGNSKLNPVRIMKIWSSSRLWLNIGIPILWREQIYPGWQQLRIQAPRQRWVAWIQLYFHLVGNYLRRGVLQVCAKSGLSRTHLRRSSITSGVWSQGYRV